MDNEYEKLAKKLHEWYLEACQKPESGMDFNPAAQEPYEALKETQKFLDRYIAGKILFEHNQVLNKIETWSMKKSVEELKEIMGSAYNDFSVKVAFKEGYNAAKQELLTLIASLRK